MIKKLKRSNKRKKVLFQIVVRFGEDIRESHLVEIKGNLTKYIAAARDVGYDGVLINFFNIGKIDEVISMIPEIKSSLSWSGMLFDVYIRDRDLIELTSIVKHDKHIGYYLMNTYAQVFGHTDTPNLSIRGTSEYSLENLFKAIPVNVKKVVPVLSPGLRYSMSNSRDSKVSLYGDVFAEEACTIIRKWGFTEWDLTRLRYDEAVIITDKFKAFNMDLPSIVEKMNFLFTTGIKGIGLYIDNSHKRAEPVCWKINNLMISLIRAYLEGDNEALTKNLVKETKLLYLKRKF